MNKIKGDMLIEWYVIYSYALFMIFSEFSSNAKVHASVKYNKTHVIPHWSLLHIWMDNYNDWLKVKSYPRIFVRYEDLLFQPLVVLL